MYPDLKQQARVLLKIGAELEGYWNSDKFLQQMVVAIKIAKIKYSSEHYNVLWFFDHSSGHTAFADNALLLLLLSIYQKGRHTQKAKPVQGVRLQKQTYIYLQYTTN